MRTMMLGLALCAPLCAQLQLNREEADRLRRIYQDHYELFVTRAVKIETEPRALDERDGARIDWYRARASDLEAAVELLDLVLRASYRLNESDLGKINRASEIVRGPKDAPSFADEFPDPEPLPVIEENPLERLRPTQPAIFGDADTASDVLEQRVQALYDGGLITRFEYLLERFRASAEPSHWAELVSYLEDLRKRGAISQEEFDRELEGVSDLPSADILRGKQIEMLRENVAAMRRQEAALTARIGELEDEILRLEFRLRLLEQP